MTETFIHHAFDLVFDRTIDAPRSAVDLCWNAAADRLEALAKALTTRSLAA